MAVITNSNPIILGTSSADTITADFGGADIFGLGGNDDYFVNAFFNYGSAKYGGSGNPDIPADIVHEDIGGGIDTVHVDLTATSDGTSYNGKYGSLSYTLGDNVENLVANLNGAPKYGSFGLNGNDLANTITANSNGESASINGYGGNDTLSGSLGNDLLNGGSGNDSMKGGANSDAYIVDNVLDKAIEAANEGNDTVYSSVSFTLGLNLENLTLIGGISNGTGNALNNRIVGNGDINVLNGLAGNDNLYGNGGNDTLNGGVGNDMLYGGNGIDKMDGGAGDDLYVSVGAGDIIADSGVGGDDTIVASEQRIGDLSAGIENLTLEDPPGPPNNYSARGNALNNTLLGNSGDNLMEGLAGNDFLNGLAGADILLGGDGNDLLDGGTGADLMKGGNGNDTYVVDNAGDVAVETNAVLATGGTDSVFSSVSFALGANVENLTLTSGSGGYGNAGKNLITGNSSANFLMGFGGDDTLDGGTGVDIMLGGDGNDTFIVDNSSDLIAENIGLASYGTADLIKSSASFDMNINAAGVENLTLTGTGNINGNGNTLNNLIIGNSGSNVLNNGSTAGNDTLQGGAGNDIYFVDDALLDKVIEAAGGGTDTVYSSVNITLGANVENLILLAGPAINGTGNTLNNTIVGNGNNNLLIGNAGNDSLNGMSGVDTMNGGAGNDTYFADTLSDVIIDSGGIDTVNSTKYGYTLGAGLENLLLGFFAGGATGTGNTSANLITGNNFGNTLDGLGGNDTLDGGGTGEVDTMIGGIGNDTFIVDNTGDIVTELSGAGTGTDLIKSSVTFSLADTDGAGSNGGNVENLTLTGSGNIDGYGNTLANIITGNDGNNELRGDAGNDTLIGGLGNDELNGGLGNDSMTGGAGDDTYLVDSLLDKVIELAGGGTDTVYSATIVSYTLAANNVENLLIGGATINGTGNALNNIMDQGSFFGGGDVVLNGAGGNDTLKASDGQDTLTGGSGDDVFNFDALHLNFGTGHITDFASGVDSLELTGFGGGLSFTGAGGSLNAAQFQVGATAVDASDRIIFDDTTGALYYDGDGNGGGGQTQIFAFTNFASAGFTVASTDIFG